MSMVGWDWGEMGLGGGVVWTAMQLSGTKTMRSDASTAWATLYVLSVRTGLYRVSPTELLLQAEKHPVF